MPVDVGEVMGLLSDLSEQEGLKVAVKEATKGSLIAAGGAFLGGLLLGPPGLFIGGALGGAAGAYATSGKFKSVAVVILELPQDKQEMLYNQVKCIIEKISFEDITALAMLVSADAAIKAELLMAVKAFVGSQMSMQILD